MNTPARILIYEDEAAPVKLLAETLRRAGHDLQLWRSVSIGQPPQLVGAGARQEWGGDRLERYASAVAIVVDVTLVTSGCTCRFCSTDNHGLHILRELSELGFLHKAFMSSSQVSRVRKEHSDFYEEIIVYIREGLSIFEDKSRPQELAAKVAAWARFDDLGYYADFETREKLYVVGMRGQRSHPEHVLIFGPSGVGKQGAAEFIHYVGAHPENRARFEPVLCGGLIGGGLAKSHLFGHVKGAYSDALTHDAGRLLTAVGWEPPSKWSWQAPDAATDVNFGKWIREGRGARFESVPGGLQIAVDAPVATVFLDEFQDLSRDVQALLMRVIEQGEIEPLGFNGRILMRDKNGRLHLRFIGASNDERIRRWLVLADKSEPLDASDTAGESVRHDLVSRLSDWIVELKAVTPAEAAFLVNQERVFRKLTLEWSDEAMRALQGQLSQKRFFGNRRQVRQLILRAAALAEHDNRSGRVLERVSLVLPRHVEEAARPITPVARPSSPAPAREVESLDEPQFVAQTIDAVVNYVQGLVPPTGGYRSRKDLKSLEGDLVTAMRDAFLDMPVALSTAAIEVALDVAGTRAVDRLKDVRWTTEAMAINRTERTIPFMQKLLLTAAEEARKIPTGAVRRMRQRRSAHGD